MRSQVSYGGAHWCDFLWFKRQQVKYKELECLLRTYKLLQLLCCKPSDTPKCFQ